MRIERIRVDGFGRLRAFDTGEAPLSPLVVVQGPNEAGKSTLFHFLTTALYGFQPASRERNPHVPWGADEAAGQVRLGLDAGGCAEIERRLRSQPSGRLTHAGRTRDLRNQPVPWVEHVPRSVFRQVFAVTLLELAGLDDETWARIQDRVVGSMGATDLRSAREVAETLEREAGELWRPNRRGNQRVRSVQQEIRALRDRRIAALERDRRVRALVDERDAARARAELLREERQRERRAVERAQKLVPVHRQLERIAALRRQGGAREDLRGIPPDPARRLAELERRREELESRAAEIERELPEPLAALERFAEEDVQRVLARSTEVAAFLEDAAQTAPERARIRELEPEVTRLTEQLEAAAEPLFTVRWPDVPRAALARVPVELLRQRVRRLDEARRQAAAAGARPGHARRVAALAVLVALGGAAVLAWGLATGRLAATALGSGLAAVALTVLLASPRARRAPRAATSSGKRRDGGRDRAAAPPSRHQAHEPLEGPEQARHDVLALLRDLPLLAEHLADPTEGLVGSLERLQDLADRWRARTEALEVARERVADLDRIARRLATALGLETTADAAALGRVLDDRLRSAERLQSAAGAARREADRLRAEQRAVDERLGAVRDEIRELAGHGRRLGAGDAAAGLEAAAERAAAHERADGLEEELARGHPDLDDLREKILALERSGEHWALDDRELDARRARIEELDQEIDDLTKRAEALDRDALHLRDMETVDAVDGEIAALQEEERRLIRERDRRWILAQLVRQADRCFRADHQPDLVQRAGSYLDHLTGGRYDRLVVDETAPGGLFQLLGPELPAPVPLARPVSTGTLEQAYLSLRLAIVDHLDQGGERLPLFIDEVFVNWDPERRARGLDVLQGLSESRQLFVFTCHPEVAAALAERGGRVLRLDRET